MQKIRHQKSHATVPLSIENIRFLAFVNKKIEDSIFGRFFNTFAN